MYMKENYQKYYKPLDQNEQDLPASEYMHFLKFWDILILLSDGLTLYGTAWLLFRMELLFATVYNSLWNVVAYIMYVFVLFIGFWISGFVVLGPYHVKFETMGIAADTLFAIINGDEIFATLHMLEDQKAGSHWIWWFSRVYMYAYVGIFSVVVINILIAIFMSAYEIVQGKVDRRLTWDKDILKRELSKILCKHSAVVHKPRYLMAFMEDERYTSRVYTVGCCNCTFASFFVPDE